MGADALVEQLREAAAEPVSEASYVQDYMRSYELRMQDIVWDFARVIRLCGGLEGKRVVDVGSGLGLFLVSADFAGAREVIGVEADEAFVDASNILLQRVGSRAKVAAGAAETLNGLVEGPVDVITSMDFIEHVYDLGRHFESAAAVLGPGGLCLAWTTLNGWFLPSILANRRLHREAEYSDFSARTGERAYLTLRQEAIRSLSPDMWEWDVGTLARRTRELAGRDLSKAVRAWEGGGVLPRPGNRLWFNVCQPVTGYWPERLLAPTQVAGLMQAAGFSVRIVRPEPYWRQRRGVRAAAKAMKRAAFAHFPLPQVCALAPGMMFIGGLRDDGAFRRRRGTAIGAGGMVTKPVPAGNPAVVPGPVPSDAG